MIQILIAITVLKNTYMPTILRNDMEFAKRITIVKYKKGKRKRKWYV